MLSRNPFHLVEVSPWPLLGSLSGMFVVSGLAFWFGGLSLSNSKWGLVMMGLVMYTWWRDVSREAGFQGFHGLDVNYGLRWGMMLFICSEVLFFFGFFWGFFHSSLAPTTELGSVWPPVGIYIINPFSIPLLNTAVLLGSGVSVTWAHHSLIEGDMRGAASGLFWTVFLGVYFTLLQKAEYVEASFSISEGVYGSIFFVATGFHGLHVLVGTSMLSVCLVRVQSEFFSSHHHFGFEASAWYWHFVDVVWIFLYMSIYWWGS